MLLDSERWFVSGQTFSKVFPSQKGWISVAAEVLLDGKTLYLKDVDFVPLETKWLPIGVAGNLAIRHALMARARQEGYTKIVIDGVRISGRNPNRLIHYERDVS